MGVKRNSDGVPRERLLEDVEMEDVETKAYEDYQHAMTTLVRATVAYALKLHQFQLTQREQFTSYGTSSLVFPDDMDLFDGIRVTRERNPIMVENDLEMGETKVYIFMPIQGLMWWIYIDLSKHKDSVRRYRHLCP